MRCQRYLWAVLGFVTFVFSGCTATRPPEPVIEPVFSFIDNQPTPSHRAMPYPTDIASGIAQTTIASKPDIVTQ